MRRWCERPAARCGSVEGVSLAGGEKVGSCEIVEPLRDASGNESYRAKDSRGRWVALRLPRETEGADADVLGKFCDEARRAGLLGKPSVLAVYEVGAYQDRTFLVTELLEGKTLRDTLEAGPLQRKKALTLALQIAQGLQAAHEKGLVHRDLRPENVFVTGDGRAKITHFGFSVLRNGAGGSDDPRDDVRALGAILHQMITGKKPGEGKIEDPAPQLVTLVNRMLSKAPTERPVAAEVAAQLAQFLAVDEAGVSGPGAYARLNALSDVLGRPVGVGTARMALRDLTEEGMKPVKPPPEKKSKAPLIIGIVVALIALAVAAFFLLGHK